MRTTLTLSDDLGERLQSLAAERRVSFKQIVSDALREGLLRLGASPSGAGYVAPVFQSGLVSGVDPEPLNSLLDGLEAEVFLAADPHKAPH